MRNGTDHLRILTMSPRAAPSGGTRSYHASAPWHRPGDPGTLHNRIFMTATNENLPSGVSLNRAPIQAVISMRNSKRSERVTKRYLQILHSAHRGQANVRRGFLRATHSQNMPRGLQRYTELSFAAQENRAVRDLRLRTTDER